MRAGDAHAVAPAAPARAAAGSSAAFGAVLAALEARAPARLSVDASDPASLLSAQAALYREVERLELASRVVDQGVGAVKTVLQTRV